MTIGASIRYHRKRLNLTQAQLAERVGVSAQAVSKWENEAGLPDISMAVPLARALGITTDELLRFGERYREFELLWEKELRTPGDDDAQRLLKVAEAALKEFPYDKIFLYRAAHDAKRIADAQQDEDSRMEYLGRAAAYAQMSVEMDPEHQTGRELRDEILAQLNRIWISQIP